MMLGRVKSYLESNKSLTHQRRSEGSNQPCVHQEPETPQRLICFSVSCEGAGQQWPAAGVGALGATDLGMT